ncbi:acyl-homoserine lactone synthase [Rhodobium orientis]|uniref:Acyl-homoserine-lactone synthase n=1 Tax=Rhodobium orientis TaxID=34017 RepID=A0A327K0E3_9HYPH|nr:acyl-homoserine-lactone synthase [Rhodobium orientis]MBB4304344.1 acyl-homoserine lactone synthase [Rhodobium orientis]MBK5948162.1 hypothetical protein [Rhodobium orientis]RAI28838.1 hypothetical protein CH339_05440 [Rhodobium orientis]
MACVIEGHKAHFYRDELEKIYRLRHQVFVDERGWKDLWKPDGREIDQFDTESAVHIAAFRNGEAAGCARLLPTVGPHLLTDVYPWLCERGPIPRGPHIIEWGRHCVAKAWRDGGQPSRVGAELILGVLEYCLPRGITECTGESDPVWISGFLQLGFDVDPLGLPEVIDDGPVVAVKMTFSDKTLETTRSVVGIPHSVLEPDREEMPVGELRLQH